MFRVCAILFLDHIYITATGFEDLIRYDFHDNRFVITTLRLPRASSKIMATYGDSLFIINSRESVIEVDSEINVISTTPGVPCFSVSGNPVAYSNSK